MSCLKTLPVRLSCVPLPTAFFRYKSEAVHKLIFLNLSFDLQLQLQKREITCLISTIASEMRGRSVVLVSFEQFQADKLITGAELP